MTFDIFFSPMDKEAIAEEKTIETSARYSTWSTQKSGSPEQPDIQNGQLTYDRAINDFLQNVAQSRSWHSIALIPRYRIQKKAVPPL
jgi:hypothetical protein